MDRWQFNWNLANFASIVIGPSLLHFLIILYYTTVADLRGANAPLFGG